MLIWQSVLCFYFIYYLYNFYIITDIHIQYQNFQFIQELGFGNFYTVTCKYLSLFKNIFIKNSSVPLKTEVFYLLQYTGSVLVFLHCLLATFCSFFIMC